MPKKTDRRRKGAQRLDDTSEAEELDGPLTVVRLESAGSSSVSSCSSWVAVYTVVCVLLPLLGAAAFLPSTLNGDFVYDDKKCVVENRDVTDGDLDLEHITRILTNDFWGTPISDPQSHKSWRPLTTISFVLSRLLHGGLDPVGFHAVNIILHGLNVELVRRCAQRVFSAAPPPGTEINSKTREWHWSVADDLAVLFTTALFAFHPMHTEAVSNVTNRAELLSLFFQLAGFVLFSGSVDSNRDSTKTTTGVVVALLFGVLAALCKETGVAVFGLFVAYDLFAGGMLRRLGHRGIGAALSPSEATVSRITMVIAVLSLFIAVRLQLQIETPTWYANTNTAVAAPTTLSRFLTLAYMDWIHFALLLFPVQFCPDWRGSVPIVSSITEPRALVALLFLSVIAHRAKTCLSTPNRERESMAWAFMVLTFLPAANVFFYVGFTIAERVTYAPSVGFCILVGAYSRHHFAVRRRQTVAVCTIVLVLCAGILNWRDQQWSNERRLWEAATESCPENFVSHVLLGNVYEKAGERDKALASFRTSLKYNNAYLIAHLNIGRILRDRKQHAAAMKSFKSATLSCDTGQTCGIVYNAVGLSCIDLQQWNEAVKYLAVAVEHDPGNRGYRNQLDHAKRMEGSSSTVSTGSDDTNLNPVEQLKELKALLKENEQQPDVHRELAAVLGKQGKLKRAAKHLERAMALLPENLNVRMEYLVTLGKSGSLQAAIKLFAETIDEHPLSIRVLYELGTLYRDVGEKVLAMQIYDRAAEMSSSEDPSSEGPSFKAKTLTNLGVYAFDNKDVEVAKELFIKALAEDPLHQSARQNLQAISK